MPLASSPLPANFSICKFLHKIDYHKKQDKKGSQEQFSKAVARTKQSDAIQSILFNLSVLRVL